MCKVLFRIYGRKACGILLALCVLLCAFWNTAFTVTAANTEPAENADTGFLNLNCKSCYLMDAATGTILYGQNAEEALPPASVTKVMTLLLIMEAIDEGKIALTDTVTVSDEAASMGGSQVFLEAGEQMTVEDLLKSVVIASANDAAYALAEFVSGSESAFVGEMNKRAAALGMTSTCFENVTGLDDSVQKHLTSARDIAIMSRELVRHEKILEYSSIWMDTIRDGAFTLTNTNRLIRFYNGAIGLKTGSTAKAGFCISAVAERDGMRLIAVIMGSPTRDIRNSEAKKLLDYGFANYGVYSEEERSLGSMDVLAGVKDNCDVKAEPFAICLPKNKLKDIRSELQMEQTLTAPVKQGDKVGTMTYYCGDEKIGEVRVAAAETVEKIGFGEYLLRLLRYSCWIW